ncbi:MAG TPA: DegV family protein, partial [Limnochordia bacterium]|nr:DegV family protein [Limnochordia bacterium]
LARAAQLCRQAVETPREGTILSVADAAARGAAGPDESSFDGVAQAALRAAETALQATPAQMEALVGRRVQDAGGFGLVVILRAFAGDGEAGRERPAGAVRAADPPAGETAPGRRVAVVTDSGADLPEALCRAHGIHVVPISVEIDGDRRLDGSETVLDELYRRMRGGTVPRTAAPSPGAFIQLYESLLARHDAVISIHISARLSGTVQAAKLAQRQLGQAGPGARLALVDSESASMGCGLVVLAAAALADGGAGLDEVRQTALRAPARLGLLGVVDSLRYLEASGRIGRARGFFGSLMQAKPLLTIQGGEVSPKGRARGRLQALAACRDFVCEHGVAERGAIMISDEPERREELLAQLPPLASGEWIVARFGATVASHIGPGSFGVAVLG